MTNTAFHGGAFFDAIGRDFQTLERTAEVVSADVLDAWFAPSPKAINKICEHLAFALRTSPPTHAEGLLQTISEVREIPPDQLLVGGGSSDLLFILLPTLIKAGDRVAILDPTYGEYAHILNSLPATSLKRVRLAAANCFDVSDVAITNFIAQEKPTVFCIVNPNNPTGRYWPKESILSFVKGHRETLFLVDEAYIDYLGKQHSLERDVCHHPSLIVVQCMSKAYALSGGRVAYAVCSPTLREHVDKLIPPWSVSLVGQIAGVEALRDEPYYAERYAETHAIREGMSAHFATCEHWRVFDSCANWILIGLNTLGADQLVETLKRKNIFIRHCGSMSNYLGNHFVRVAVKDPCTAQRVVTEMANCADALSESAR